MALFVNGRRVITKAPGAIVRSKSKNYTSPKRLFAKDYENICKSEDLENCCEDVKVDGYAVATLDSFFPQSYGDEAGSGGGVKSGTINGKGVFKTASPDTFVSSVDGSICNVPIIREGDLVVSNNGNCEPAPIEFLPGMAADNPFALPEPDFNLNEDVYHSSHIIHGRNLPIKGYIINYCPLLCKPMQGKNISFEDPKDVKGNSKRLYLRNSRDQYVQQALYINQDATDWVYVPFPTSKAPTILDKTKKLAYKDEPHQSVVLRLVADYQLPTKKVVNAANNDYSDIFRLSDDLREKVYHNIINYKLTKTAALFDDETGAEIVKQKQWSENAKDIPLLKDFDKTWYEILPENLQTAVDNELSKAQISSLNDGWLYVYLNGHLWREIEVRKGLLHDVNLVIVSALEERPALGLGEESLLLPYKILGQQPKVEIAFSDKQWTWQRIRHYGGMKEDDNRRYEKDPAGDAVGRAKYRKKRFIEIDLKPLIDGKQVEVCDTKGNIVLFEEFGVHHLVIPNILLPMHRAMSDIATLRDMLMQLVEDLQNPLNAKNYNTAALCYKYFFNPKNGILAKQKNTQDIKDAYGTNQLARSALMANRSPHIAAQAAKMAHSDQDNALLQLDLDLIKATLKVEKRQRIRDIIRTLQSSLVGMIETPLLPSISNIQTSLQSQRPFDWHQCLKDYFTGDLNSYNFAFTFIGAIAGALNLEPSALDNAIDIELDVDVKQLTIGQKYLLNTLEKDYPLHELIHPNTNVLAKAKPLPRINHHEEFDALFPDYKHSESDSEEFNQSYFSYLFGRGLVTFKGVFDGVNSGIQSYMSGISDALEKSNQHTIAIEKFFEISINHFKVAKHPDIPKVYMSKAVPEGHAQLGLHHLDFFNNETKQSIKSEVATIDNKFTVDGFSEVKFDKSTGEIIVSYSIAEQASNETLKFASSGKKAKEFVRKTFNQKKITLQEKLDSTAVDTLTSSKNSRVITIKEQDTRDISMFGKRLSHIVDKGTTSALLLLSVWNVKNKFNAMNEYAEQEGKISSEKIADMMAESLSASYMLENITRSFSDIDHVRKWYMNRSSFAERNMIDVLDKGFAFTPLSALGTIGCVINIGLSLNQTANDLYKHNPALAVSSMTQTGLNMAITMNLIGDAAHFALADRMKDKLAEKAFKKATEHLATEIAKRIALEEVMTESGFGFVRKLVIRNCLKFTGGYIGMFLLFASVGIEIVRAILDESELVKWARSTPFALNTSDAEANQEILLAKFANIITKPTAKIAKTKADEYYVEIFLASFDEEHDQIKLEVFSADINLETPAMPSFTGAAFIPHIAKTNVFKHKLLKKSVIYDQHLQLYKIRIYFETYNSVLHAKGNEHEIRAQYKIILKNGIRLPVAKYQGSYPLDGKGTSQFYRNYYHTPALNILGSENA